MRRRNPLLPQVGLNETLPGFSLGGHRKIDRRQPDAAMLIVQPPRISSFCFFLDSCVIPLACFEKKWREQWDLESKSTDLHPSLVKNRKIIRQVFQDIATGNACWANNHKLHLKHTRGRLLQSSSHMPWRRRGGGEGGGLKGGTPADSKYRQ